MKIKAYLPNGKFKLLIANSIVDIMIIDLEYERWEYL